MYMVIKSVKYCEICVQFKKVKDDFVVYNCLCCNDNQKKFVNTYKFSRHNFNTFISLFQKVFINMNIWMIQEKSMKNHYLKKMTLESPNYGKCY